MKYSNDKEPKVPPGEASTATLIVDTSMVKLKATNGDSDNGENADDQGFLPKMKERASQSFK